jgi:hypothetical protein
MRIHEAAKPDVKKDRVDTTFFYVMKMKNS